MFTLPLAVGLFMNLLMVLWVAIAILLTLIILIQKAKGGGLSSAFGGLGASSLLGTKTGDVLTWVTISLAVVFLGLGAFLVKFYVPTQATDMREPAPATTPAASSPATGDAAAPATGTPAAPAGDGAGAGQPVTPTPAPVEAPPAPAQPTPAEPAPAAPGGN